jgi:branched-chain amino acid transport system ATP-binding protein
MRFFRVCRSVGVTGSMSGGEQQMCAMARGLMAAPILLMIDEMSLGLAPVIVEQLINVLAAIRDDGMTVLLVEQDVNLALSIADRGYVMETGPIVHSGPARQLIDGPEVRRAYLGLGGVTVNGRTVVSSVCSKPLGPERTKLAVSYQIAKKAG